MTPEEEKIIGISLGVVALIGGIWFYVWYQGQVVAPAVVVAPTTTTTPIITNALSCTGVMNNASITPPYTTCKVTQVLAANISAPKSAPIAASQARVLNIPTA